MTCENCGHENQAGARFCAGCGGPLPSGETDPTYPLIGQVVGGRYHIVGLIGEGGMGVVYKAEQRLGSTVRKVAVKTLHADLSRDPAITARFHREVGTIAQLEHPNTVKVYDFGSTDDGTLYIAMEFLDGKPLNRVIQAEGALEPRRVGNLLRQIAGSLDEAHRQGIVHRDLKPENVILIERAGEKDVVKLVDFGIAARTESADRAKEQKLTQQGMVLGTPPYMSPEQFTGKALDARSDVYSLGIMTYEMLTGQLPFQADTPWQWATHHMTSQPRPFEELPAGRRLPEGLRKAVLRSLAKDPNERQSGAGQFQSEFMAGLSGVATAPPRAPVNPSGKTEAMPEMALPLGIAATQAMPEASPFAAPKVAIPTPPGAVALPPSPAREGGPGNKKLVYGLGAAAGVLGIALVAAALSSRGGGSDSPPVALQPIPEQPATNAPAASGSAAEPTTVEPDPIPPSTPPREQPAAPKPASSTTKPASTKPSTPATSPSTPAKPTGTTPQAPPTTQVPTGTPTPPVVTPPVTTPPVTAPPAGDACATCQKAAQSGDIAAAAQAYAQCTNPGAKTACQSRVGQKAGDAAVFAANNGKCAEARAILLAAQQMGVAAGRLAKAQTAVAGCK
jgi:serine/threonine-protein kinase